MNCKTKNSETVGKRTVGIAECVVLSTMYLFAALLI